MCILTRFLLFYTLCLIINNRELSHMFYSAEETVSSNMKVDKKQTGGGKTNDNMRKKMPNCVGFRWLRPQKCRAAPQATHSSAALSFLQPKWDVRAGKQVSFVDIRIILKLSREWEEFLLEMQMKEMAERGTGGEITQPVLEKCLRLIRSPELQENVPVQSLAALVCPTCYIPVKLVFSSIEQLRTGPGEVK